MRYDYSAYWELLRHPKLIVKEINNLEEWLDWPEVFQCPFDNRYKAPGSEKVCVEFLCRKRWPFLLVGHDKYCPCPFLREKRKGLTKRDVLRYVAAHIRAGKSFLKKGGAK